MTKPCDRGSSPFLSAKLFERALLLCFELILSRLIPIGGFTGGAHFWFTLRALAWHPFMLASAASVAFLFNCDRCHESEDILDSNILSRYILVLTDIYLKSNILLR
jgi:hypothetical protein